MKDLFFMIAFVLVSAVVLFQGVLMLVWPDKHTKFEDWLARSDRWSRPNREWKPGLQLEKRFAGLAAIAVALLMLRLPLGWFLHRRPITWVGHEGIP